MTKELKTAIQAAKLGAKQALKYYDKNIKIELKEDHTPVTIADRETEEVIKKCILQSFPNARFVGEESGGTVNEDEFWTIDPIDGTRSFSRGIPLWCVLIAFCKKGEVQAGVCYFPLLNSMLYAEKGKGAYLNKRKVNVSRVNKISECFFTFGNPKYIKNKQALLQLFEVCGATRGLEATYGHFLAIQGKTDVSIDGYGLVWDTAPLKVITEEAGGKISRLDGEPWSFSSGRGCIISNSLLYNEVIRILNQ